MYGSPAPLVATGPDLDLTLDSDRAIAARLVALQTTQRDIWSQLSALYAPVTTDVPHQFQPRDIV